MADMSYRPVDDFVDDDPTEELPMLPGSMMEPEEDIATADPDCATNNARENEHLDTELREANDRVSELSSELSTRTEAMRSIQCELNRLREVSESLEKEVESGKGTISDVTDELVSVRTQQNYVSEQLRRRQQQITTFREKLAKKDAFIEELGRRVDIAGLLEKQDHIDSQKINGSHQTDNANASDLAVFQDGQAQENPLRMLVARHDKGTSIHPVLTGGISIGKSLENDVQLEDAFVSYRHARITETSAGCLLRDLDSSNGTWINQRRVRWQLLRDGDLIDFGPLRFEFIDKSEKVQNEQTEEDAGR
jgi:hypothetical protein